MASAVSGLRTGAWALAVGGRGFIHRLSGSGGAYLLPLGIWTEATWIQIILLVVCFFKKQKTKKKNTLKMHNSIVAAEKPNKVVSI